RGELLQRMREHIHTVVGRYKGKVKCWDVVNEAIADVGGTNILRNSLWLEIIGPDVIAKAFQYAHEADPDAILRYNDYGLDNSANASATQGGLVTDADKKLSDAYAGIFGAFLKHRDAVKMVTFWGANDANSWRAQGKPLLFDGNSQPKRAFDAVIAEAKKAS